MRNKSKIQFIFYAACIYCRTLLMLLAVNLFDIVLVKRKQEKLPRYLHKRSASFIPLLSFTMHLVAAKGGNVFAIYISYALSSPKEGVKTRCFC